MFESARLKLTAWYLLIIMVISGMFSVAFYQTSTREIQRIISRVKSERIRIGNTVFITSPPGIPSLEELEEVPQHLAANLIMLNACILVLAGLSSYILASKTLKPIQRMVLDQDEFISNASHELRTPIAILRAEMEASLLEKRITDAQARALISSNLEELTRLQNLSNYLLQITRLQNRETPQAMERINVKDIVDAAVTKIATLSKKKGIKLHVGMSDAFVRADKEMLLNVFVILLDNAVKYTHKGGKISVSMKHTSQTVRISVQDSGVGITEADLPHIFERFYRADKSRSQADGYGLGLAIAKQSVETLGGMIAAESVFKKGTTMTVQLPKVK